ncbi:MAG: GntR family transcriptional regulator [Planctomycetota bacterium]|jgi:GntR family transcriptional regulator
MLVEIDTHSGVPIYRQVIEQIRRQIMTGQLGEGGQLPTVRDLAGRLKVNPMTVSKAYSLLEIEGLVERRRGVGLFVAKLSKRQKERIRKEMLEGIVKKAAITAVQLGVSEQEVKEVLLKLYRQYDKKRR